MMNKKYPQSTVFMGAIILFLAFVTRCATPQFPEGGPVDAQPPFIVSANPDTNAVNVATDRLIVQFSEYINTGSFQQALSITPAFSRPPQIRWRGRQAEIRFPDELRDSTTYVVTIDKTLRDLNGVALTRPITWAFSSGSKIDKGQISGRVIDPETGKGVDGFDLFAYAGGPPESWESEPAYRMQTDDQGAFRLQFLPETPFFVLAIEDRNRNRRPDNDERTGIPFSELISPSLSDSVSAPTPVWLIAESDTTAPQVRRVRSASSRRHVVFHSESVQLLSLDPDVWELSDSTSGVRIPIRALYVDDEAAQQVYFVTDSLANTVHRVVPASVADSSGNQLRQSDLFFTPPARADTVRTRFLGFHPIDARRPGEVILDSEVYPALRFSQPADTSTVRMALALNDTLGNTYGYDLKNLDGRTYAVLPDPVPEGRVVEFEFQNSYFGTDSVYTQSYRRRAPDELGGIVGKWTGSYESVVLQIYTEQDQRALRSKRLDSTGVFSFALLPEGSYRLRYFNDQNGDGKWSPGSAVPYTAPESYGWHQEIISVRRRFDTEIDSLAPAYNTPIPVVQERPEERE